MDRAKGLLRDKEHQSFKMPFSRAKKTLKLVYEQTQTLVPEAIAKAIWR
jgi:hypothetical protein